MRTVQLLIKGKVQGVFYRASAKKMADQLHIGGWVKNAPEGDVACLASGDEAAVEAFIAWCKKGPKQAFVKEVIATEKELLKLDEFSILR